MHKKYFQMLALVAFAVDSATNFAAQQARSIQSLDENEHTSAASSTVSSAVSSSATQAQVSVEALTEQQLNREYRLVLPNGENMMFPVRLLRHAGLFRSIIEANPEVVDIPVGQYIATLRNNENNLNKMSLVNFYSLLSSIDDDDNHPGIPDWMICNIRSNEANIGECLIQALLIGSYFEIPALFEVAKDLMIDWFNPHSANKNVFRQLPDDIQAQVLGGYVEKSTIIKDFFNTPKRTANRTDILGTSILSPDRNFITEAAYNSFGRWHVIVKSVRTNKKLLSYALGKGSRTTSMSGLRALNCSPDGTRIVFGFANGKICVRKINYSVETDTATLGDALILQGHATGLIDMVKYSPDETTIASLSADGWTVRFWNAITGEHLTSLQTPFSELFDIAYSPDGTKIAIVAHDAIFILDSSTHNKICALDDHDNEVIHIKWSADGRKIICAARDDVILWNLESGQKISFNWCDLIPSGHASTPILSTELSSDGTELSASTSTTTWTWNVPTPDLYLLTLPELELVEKIITEKSIPGKSVADSDDQSKKLYETYETLSDRWKQILINRFASTSAEASAVGAEASSSSAASSAVT